MNISTMDCLSIRAALGRTTLLRGGSSNDRASTSRSARRNFSLPDNRFSDFGFLLSEDIKPRPDDRVIRWLGANEADFVVDPSVLGELAIGFLILPHVGVNEISHRKLGGIR